MSTIVRNLTKQKSGNTSKRTSFGRGRKIRIGVESMDRFFSRMRANARKLDRDERRAPGLTLSFEDPGDFLEVITPARYLMSASHCAACTGWYGHSSTPLPIKSQKRA